MSQRDLKPWMMPWPMHVERMHHETMQRLPPVYQRLQSEHSDWGLVHQHKKHKQ